MLLSMMALSCVSGSIGEGCGAHVNFIVRFVTIVLTRKFASLSLSELAILGHVAILDLEFLALLVDEGHVLLELILTVLLLDSDLPFVIRIAT